MHSQCPKIFDSEFQVNRKARRALSHYVGGLLLYPGKKNCSAIARASNVDHEIVYEFLECHIEEKVLLQSFLNRVFSALPLKKGVWFINIDETLIDKIFSEKIEAVAYNWSSTHNDTLKGLAIIVAVITNGKITIPITFKTWRSSKEFPDKHKTRIELAQELMIEINKKAPGIMFLMDGAFSSEGMLSFCATNKIRYCMRFHSNKKVVINGKEEQVRNHKGIKMSSKKKGRVVNGYYKGISVFIVAFKRIDKNGKEKFVYLITSEKASPKKMIRIYKKRWFIEKAFRTAKQHLGLRDCQARSTSKQEAHIFAVFVAFAFLEIQKFDRGAKNPEQILHKIRLGRSVQLRDQIETFCN
jgi:Transposase DDE domain